MQGKISVIIPMYNSEHTIIKCLNSIKNQTYNAIYQVLIINDGSTDNSLQAITEYQNNLDSTNIEIEIINKQNGGVSSARNIGLEKAEGGMDCIN